MLEREREETKEAEYSVASLRRQLASQREAVAALDADIEQYRARVANLRKGQFLLFTSIVPRTHPHQSEKGSGKHWTRMQHLHLQSRVLSSVQRAS